MERQEGFVGMESSAMSLPGAAGGPVASALPGDGSRPMPGAGQRSGSGSPGWLLNESLHVQARPCLCASVYPCAASLELGFILGWHFASSLEVFWCHIRLPFGS